MGRKSNTKKKVREILKEEDKKEKIKKKGKKKVKEQVKEEVKKSNEPVPKEEKEKKKFQFKFNIPVRRLVIGFLAAAVAVLILSFAYQLFQRAFRAQPIANYLPAENTIALVELNTDFNHNQLIRTFDLLSSHPEYSKNQLLHKAETYLNLNYERELKPWLGRQVAIAVTKNEDQSLNTYYFAEISNRQAYNNFAANLQTAHTQIGNYHVSANSEEALNILKNSDKKLSQTESYRKIENNSPITRIANFYLDFSNLNDNFFAQFPLLSQQGLSYASVQPLLPLLDAEGITLVAREDNFALQSYLKLAPEVVEQAQYLKKHERYSADLTKYIRHDALAFWGGRNLETQIKRLIEIFTGGDSIKVAIADNLIQQYTKKYFGADVNFNQDILPIFRKEFAFAIEKYAEQNGYKFVMELSSPQADAIRLADIANSFANIGAVFQPRVVEHILEDGTVAKEIIAVPEEIAQKETTYKEQVIHELELGAKEWGVYYVLIDNIAVFSTQREGVTNAIDLIDTPESSLANTVHYQESIIPVMRNADEVSYLNLEMILPMLFEGKSEVPEPLGIISSFTSGRNYFNDGIMTLNYLEIK